MHSHIFDFAPSSPGFLSCMSATHDVIRLHNTHFRHKRYCWRAMSANGVRHGMWRLRWYMVFVLAYDVCVGFGIWRLHRQMKFMLAYGVCFDTLHHRQHMEFVLAYDFCFGLWCLCWHCFGIWYLCWHLTSTMAFSVCVGRWHLLIMAFVLAWSVSTGIWVSKWCLRWHRAFPSASGAYVGTGYAAFYAA